MGAGVGREGGAYLGWCPPRPLFPASVRNARLPLPLAAARAQNQYSPLHYAAGNNHAEVVGLLLKRGADTEARNVVSASCYTVLCTAYHTMLNDTVLPYIVAMQLCFLYCTARYSALHT